MNFSDVMIKTYLVIQGTWFWVPPNGGSESIKVVMPLGGGIQDKWD